MKMNPELQDKIINGFRVIEATDMESVEAAVLMARVTGSIGSTHKETAPEPPEVMDRTIVKYAKVMRADLP